MAFRFVHTADLHLDSPLRSLAMRNEDLAELIGDATRQALIAIIDLCIDEQGCLDSVATIAGLLTGIVPPPWLAVSGPLAVSPRERFHPYERIEAFYRDQ